MKRFVCLMLTFVLLLGLSASATAGSKSGPRRWKRKIQRNQEVVYKITFLAGRPAEFAFIGDGSSDLDLYITDSAGKKVAGGFDQLGRPSRDGKDYFTTDIAVIRWIPTRTQVYTIRIKPYTVGENEVYFGHN